MLAWFMAGSHKHPADAPTLTCRFLHHSSDQVIANIEHLVPVFYGHICLSQTSQRRSKHFFRLCCYSLPTVGKVAGHSSLARPRSRDRAAPNIEHRHASVSQVHHLLSQHVKILALLPGWCHGQYSGPALRLHCRVRHLAVAVAFALQAVRWVFCCPRPTSHARPHRCAHPRRNGARRLCTLLATRLFTPSETAQLSSDRPVSQQQAIDAPSRWLARAMSHCTHVLTCPRPC
jgi:hypothetical protein